MKERGLEVRTQHALEAGFPSGEWTKFADRFTSGIPDAQFAWHGFVTALEFKHLGPEESVHSGWEDQSQFDKLLRLETATKRAWLVVFRKGRKPVTEIYRPSALINIVDDKKTCPSLEHVEPKPHRVLEQRESPITALTAYGVAQYEGHNFDAVCALIYFTHQSLEY